MDNKFILEIVMSQKESNELKKQMNSEEVNLLIGDLTFEDKIRYLLNNFSYLCDCTNQLHALKDDYDYEDDELIY